ncbi:MAG: hypothetical protein K9M08_21350 [Pirellula sp.]|nr:hypothetical protein [Pirellula sp.]
MMSIGIDQIDRTTVESAFSLDQLAAIGKDLIPQCHELVTLPHDAGKLLNVPPLAA